MNFYGREEEQKRIDYLLSKADFASGIEDIVLVK